jgi:hypothetical protein
MAVPRVKNKRTMLPSFAQLYKEKPPAKGRRCCNTKNHKNPLAHFASKAARMFYIGITNFLGV